MKKRYIFLILGFLLAIMPILGFPTGIKNTFYIIVGIIIMILSYKWGDSNSARNIAENIIEKTFAENKPLPRVDAIHTNESN